MKIPSKDLSFQLKRGLASLYCVLGDEPLQHQEALDTLRAHAKTAGYSERAVFEITPQFTWEHLLPSFQHLSLFSSKKVIECRFLEGKIGPKAQEILRHLSSHISTPDIFLLLSIHKLDTKLQRSDWFSTLEQKGCIVTVRMPSPPETLLWIQKRLLSSELKATPEAIHLLLERTEGNLLAAAQAIEKLRSLGYSLAHPCTPRDILKVVGQEAQFSVYDLVDAFLSGVVLRTTRIFACLRDQGVDPILVLWAITREIRMVIEVSRKMKAGEGLSMIFKTAGVWKHREPLVKQFVERFSETQCQKALLQAQKIDEYLKGRAPGNVWDALWMLCLSLADPRPSKIRDLS